MISSLIIYREVYLDTISVIITTYNDSEYLERSISSVLKQSYLVSELIIVDDGSDTDEAKVIAKGFINNNQGIRVVYFYQENLGPSSAKNKGVELSSSKYITFLDADDEYYIDNLECKFKLIKSKNPSSNYIAIYGSYRNSYNNLVEPVMDMDGIPKTSQIDTVGKKNGISGSLPSYVILREKFLEVGGLDADLPINEDFDFILRLIKLGFPILGTNKPGFYRDYRPYSHSRSDFLFSSKKQLTFFKKAFKFNLMSDMEIMKRFGVLSLRLVKFYMTKIFRG